MIYNDLFKYIEFINLIFSFIAQHYVDSRLDSIRDRLHNPSQEKGAEFLTYLLSSEKFSMDDIYSNICEVMLGGIDTVVQLFFSQFILK